MFILEEKLLKNQLFFEMTVLVILPILCCEGPNDFIPEKESLNPDNFSYYYCIFIRTALYFLRKVKSTITTGYHH